jgi:hypothetical protein
MTSELGRNIADRAVSKLEDTSFIHKAVFSPEVKQYFNITQEGAARRVKDYLLPFGGREQISINPLEQPCEQTDLYLPCLGLLTYCILVCICNVERGQFHGHLLSANHLVCLVLVGLEAVGFKLGLSMVALPRSVLELLSHLGYQFIPMSVVCLVAWLAFWPLTLLVLAYTLLINFRNLDAALRKGADLTLSQQTAVKAVSGVHLAVCLLILKVTGAI